MIFWVVLTRKNWPERTTGIRSAGLPFAPRFVTHGNRPDCEGIFESMLYLFMCCKGLRFK